MCRQGRMIFPFSHFSKSISSSLVCKSVKFPRSCGKATCADICVHFPGDHSSGKRDLIDKQTHSQLPNLSGHLCVSIGKSSRFIGQPALIVSLQHRDTRNSQVNRVKYSRAVQNNRSLSAAGETDFTSTGALFVSGFTILYPRPKQFEPALILRTGESSKICTKTAYACKFYYWPLVKTLNMFYFNV